MNPKHLLVYIISLVAAVAAHAAQAVDPAVVQQLRQRIAALEEEVRALGGVEPTNAPVMAAGRESKLAVAGYVQAHAEFGDAPDARFPAADRILMRRARLGVKGAFAENFDFTVQSDFGNNSIGGVSGYRAQITDCFVTWNRIDAANLVFGQFKTPYGYEQLLPDTKIPAVERSLPNDQLTLSRQIGGMLTGSLWQKRLGYSAGFFNGNGVNNGANDNEQFLYVGRVTALVAESKRGRLAVGLNGFTTRDTGTFTGRRVGTGTDLQAAWGPFELQAEYLRSHFDRDVGVDSDANGWSLLGAVMILPKAVQGLVRYERYDPNRATANDDSELWTVGVNVFLKGDDLKLSLNYLIGDPAGPLRNQRRFLARTQLVF